MLTVEKPKRRLRIPKPKAGTPIGTSQITQVYGPPRSTIQVWEKKKEIVRMGTDPTTGAAIYDELSIWERCQYWKPNRDSSAKTRVRTAETDKVANLQAESPAHHAVGAGGNGVDKSRNGQAARPAAPIARVGDYLIPAGTFRSEVPEGVPLRLDNKSWYQLYINRNQDKWGDRTREAIRTFANRFLKDFPVLDLTNPLMTREAIWQWLSTCPDLQRSGQTISDGSRETLRKKAKTYLGWLKRNYDYPLVDLTQFGWKEGRGIPMDPWRTREILKVCRDATERDLVYLFAQTGARISDIVTINPQLIHTTADGLPYFEAFGKATRANEYGYRRIPLPSECYRRLRRHLENYGELVWIKHQYCTASKHRCETIPIGGTIVQADPRRPIDLNEPRETGQEPKSFRVQMAPQADAIVGDVIEKLIQIAGVYTYGLRCHGWRHAYTGEWLDRGGDSKLCDLVLGHFSRSKISDRYTHVTIDVLCRETERYAPRAFLQEQAPQGALPILAD